MAQIIIMFIWVSTEIMIIFPGYSLKQTSNTLQTTGKTPAVSFLLKI